MAKPIRVWRINGVSQSPTRRLAEKASQTFKHGVPVVVEAATGYLIEVTAPAGTTELIAGFSQEPGANLTSSGVAKTLTYGSVQNQANAVLIPGGAPLNDGKCGVNIADDNVEFVIDFLAAGTPAVTDVGKIYGIQKNANGYWEIDTSKTTEAGGACVEVTEVIDLTAGGRVAIKVNKTRHQFGK
jgi:hypothetical protein